jgi:gamma-glutamylcyclotransferase (GGCT)/AIG2-like uncharacterized protein YtfP
MNVFAYGRLRSGGGDLYDQVKDRVLETCPAVLEGRLFALADGRAIAVEGEPSYPVQGEVLTTADSPTILKLLDGLFEVRHPDSPYHRVQRRVLSDRGDELAWVYLCKHDALSHVFMDGSEIEDGDWLVWHLRRVSEGGSPADSL